MHQQYKNLCIHKLITKKKPNNNFLPLKIKKHLYRRRPNYPPMLFPQKLSKTKAFSIQSRNGWQKHPHLSAVTATKRVEQCARTNAHNNVRRRIRAPVTKPWSVAKTQAEAVKKIFTHYKVSTKFFQR